MENYTKIAIGVVAGIAVGSILGVLFAPNKGAETRTKIKNAGAKLNENVQDKINKGKQSLYSMKQNILESLDNIEEKTGDYI